MNIRKNEKYKIHAVFASETHEAVDFIWLGAWAVDK